MLKTSGRNVDISPTRFGAYTIRRFNIVCTLKFLEFFGAGVRHQRRAGVRWLRFMSGWPGDAGDAGGAGRGVARGGTAGGTGGMGGEP
jgi:hypothetical protein